MYHWKRLTSLIAKAFLILVVCNVPSVGQEGVSYETRTEAEAFVASDGRIVLFYGEGIRRVEITVEILRNDGYPVVAYSGGPPDQLFVFVNRNVLGPFDQEAIHAGVATNAAAGVYDQTSASEE